MVQTFRKNDGSAARFEGRAARAAGTLENVAPGSGRDAPSPGARCPREADLRGNGNEGAGAESACGDDVPQRPPS